MNGLGNASPSVNETESSASIEKNKLIKLIIDLAEQMLSCGGEVSRVEETVVRICTAYGVAKTDVFCITTVIIVTAMWDDGEIITQTRRISQGSRNFNKLEMLNALSREVCRDTPPSSAALFLVMAMRVSRSGG